MWLQAGGPKRHSDVQLQSGENLTNLKRKYKQSLCLYCAGENCILFYIYFWYLLYFIVLYALVSLLSTLFCIACIKFYVITHLFYFAFICKYFCCCTPYFILLSLFQLICVTSCEDNCKLLSCITRTGFVTLPTPHFIDTS